MTGSLFPFNRYYLNRIKIMFLPRSIKLIAFTIINLVAFTIPNIKITLLPRLLLQLLITIPTLLRFIQRCINLVISKIKCLLGHNLSLTLFFFILISLIYSILIFNMILLDISLIILIFFRTCHKPNGYNHIQCYNQQQIY